MWITLTSAVVNSTTNCGQRVCFPHSGQRPIHNGSSICGCIAQGCVKLKRHFQGKTELSTQSTGPIATASFIYKEERISGEVSVRKR